MRLTIEQIRERLPNVSRETYADLVIYEGILLRWNKKINLISPDTQNDLWTRHFVDSLQLKSLLGQTDGKVADLGSGGGFPGIPMSIATRSAANDFVLVDSDQRKCAFLRAVSQELGLNLTIISARIEQMNSLQVDIIMARALAPLTTLLSYATQHLKAGGRAFFLKGANAMDELSIAREKWRFNCIFHTSLTNPQAKILEVSEISGV